MSWWYPEYGIHPVPPAISSIQTQPIGILGILGLAVRTAHLKSSFCPLSYYKDLVDIQRIIFRDIFQHGGFSFSYSMNANSILPTATSGIGTNNLN